MIKKELKYTYYPEYMEEEDYLKILLISDVLFINNGWWNKNWPKDNISIHVNCNDVFYWGSADSEDILFSELKELYEMYEIDPNWGPAVWCIKKRQMQPQEPVKKMIKELGIWDLDKILKKE